MSLKKAKKDNILSPKYYGPYKVVKNIQVHPVFHVLFLKKVIGENIPVQTIFP